MFDLLDGPVQASRLPTKTAGKSHPVGHGVEQDFRKSAAVVVAGAEEQNAFFFSLPHRSTILSVSSFGW
jgi:hypothetical protein